MTKAQQLSELLAILNAYHDHVQRQLEMGGPHARMVARATIAVPEYRQLMDRASAVRKPKKKPA